MTDESPPPPSASSSERLPTEFRDELLRRVRGVLEATEPLGALHHVAIEVARELPADRCSIIGPFGPRAARILACSDAEPAEDLLIFLERYPELQAVFDSESAVLIRDVGVSDLLEPVRDLMRHSETISLATVPLRLPEMLGILRVTSSGEHFTPSDLDWLRAVAHVIEGEISGTKQEVVDEGQWAHLVRDLADATLEVAPDTRIVEVSVNLHHPLGRAFAGLEGRYLTEVLGDPDHRSIGPSVVELLQGRRPTSRKPLVVHLQGEPPASVLAVAAPCRRPLLRVRVALKVVESRSRGGSVSSEQVVIPSTPDEVVDGLLESTLRQQAKELGQLRKTVDQLTSRRTVFLTASAHELKTPLTILQIYLETLLGDLSAGMSDEQLEFLQICHESLMRLRQLVLNLVDLAALESGGLDLSIGRVDIQPELVGLIDEMKPLTTHAGVHLELELADDLPPARVDSERVKQVVRNLLDNAIKYTPATGSVTLRAHSEQDSLVLTVEDTGIGIPAERLDDIFIEFTSFGEDDSHRDSGSGLGLAVCRRLTKALGGTISVDSREGRGTTFTLRFPRWPNE